MSGSSRATPVIVVSGFLGSGKTTLIRRLLREPRLGEVAIIVNEFGEVGIDHHLMRKTDERTTLLRNGCVCCSMRDDLKDALIDLLGKRGRGQIPRFERVLIETTGLADPVPILQTIVSEPVIRHHFRVERVIATIDAVGGRANLATYGEAVRQIAAADEVVVTKQDLATGEAAAALKAAVRRINPTASLVDASFGAVPIDVLLGGASRSSPLALLETVGDGGATMPPTAHGAGGRVTSRCVVFDRPLHWQMFGIWLTMLLHRHGDRILRLKGLLNVGEDKGPLLLEGVQHVIHAPRHLAAWPDDDRRSRLVFITRDLDPSGIEASLNAFQDVAESV